MTPDMDNVPVFIARTIADSAEFAGAGLQVFNPSQPDHGSGIVIHDFSPGAKMGFEKALEKTGLCFVVTSFDDASRTDATHGGYAATLNFTLQAHESVETNRGASGTGIPCDRALFKASKALLAAVWPGNFKRRLSVGNLRNLGDQNGVWACTASVGIPIQLP